jgi:2-polyprenyl-3-methyl-5-hydroxy-6-metoxy-1,4-benzoquinol methylase
VNFPFYAQAPKESVDRCNLCGSSRRHLQNTIDRYGLTAPSVQCEDCGLVYLSCRMTPTAYRTFYQDGHYRELLSLFYGRPITAANIEVDQARYALRLERWLDSYMDKIRGGTMLDLGGSTGVVADWLAKAYNLDATVVEPSAGEAGRAHDKGLAVAQVPLEEYDAGGNHYDLVLLCQTVDHLLDIAGDLARIRQWVAPGGLFFVDFVEDGPIKIDHPYYLSRKTMAKYLSQAGLTVKAEEKSEDGLHVNVLAEVAA